MTVDDDVLVAAKAMAQRQRQHQRKSVGEVVSSLIRPALQPAQPRGNTRHGVPLLPTRPGAVAVTLELVNRLRDDLP